MRKHDYEEWRRDGRTEQFMRALEAEAMRLSRLLGEGSALDQANCAMHYANQVGVIAGIRAVIGFDPTEEDM